MSEVVGREEFTNRLVALCIGGSSGPPRRSRDLHILLASATLWMEEGAIYTEPEINEGLSRWLQTGCPSLDLDVVTLRRELVDHLYLDRNDSGTSYSAGSGPVEPRFDDEVATVDPAEVISQARDRQMARRVEHMSGESQPTRGG